MIKSCAVLGTRFLQLYKHTASKVDTNRGFYSRCECQCGVWVDLLDYNLALNAGEVFRLLWDGKPSPTAKGLTELVKPFKYGFIGLLQTQLLI